MQHLSRFGAWTAFLLVLLLNAALLSGTEFPTADTTRTYFPDEFSDLDEGGSGASLSQLEPAVTERLDRARDAYFTALSWIEKRDTVRAAREFEKTIRLLNELSSEPGIELVPDFTDLVTSVIEDYEAYITNIDKLDEDASISILRRKMFDDIERKPAVEPIAGATPKPPAKKKATTIALPMNEDVEKSLQFLTTDRGRPYMKRWLERSGRWFPVLRQIAREEDMPEEIIYLAMMESGLNPNAVSWAKAVGMWQFIASTGKMYDLEVGPWVDERRNVEKATRAAMRFLKDLYNELGDWHLALAAYNCGPGGVRRARRRAGLPDGNFWEIRDKLPRETRNYVPLYIATTLVTMNPEQYGFPADSLTMHTPLHFDTFTVPEAVNLAALAKCAGISEDSLKALNPELVRPCTPPNVAYKLKIPPTSKDAMARNFALLTAKEKEPWVTHVVQRRETLAGIARTYNVTVADLAAINGIKGYKSRLRRGAKLRVPVTDAKDEPALIAKTNATAPTTTQPPIPTDTTSRQLHVVRSGETLTSIATRYSVRVDDLRSWNDMAPTDQAVLPGDTLIVSVVGRPTTVASVERIRVKKVVNHKVRKGETLTDIAQRYGTSVSSIRSLNHMSRRSALKYGTSIKVETTVVTNRTVAETPARSTTTKAASSKYYTVRRGDTLSGIAERNNKTIAELRAMNPSVGKRGVIRAGQKLRVQ